MGSNAKLKVRAEVNAGENYDELRIARNRRKRKAKQNRISREKKVHYRTRLRNKRLAKENTNVGS